MSEVHLTITEDQREFLVQILSNALTSKRREVHRTEFSREFRRELEDEEIQIQDLLDKLSQAVLGSTTLGEESGVDRAIRIGFNPSHRARGESGRCNTTSRPGRSFRRGRVRG